MAKVSTEDMTRTDNKRSSIAAIAMVSEIEESMRQTFMDQT